MTNEFPFTKYAAAVTLKSEIDPTMTAAEFRWVQSPDAEVWTSGRSWWGRIKHRIKMRFSKRYRDWHNMTQAQLIDLLNARIDEAEKRLYQTAFDGMWKE